MANYMAKHFAILFLMALGLGACAPQVQQHRLSQSDLASFGLSTVQASVAPSASVSWPVRDGNPASKALHASEEVLQTIEQAYKHELRGVFPGKQKVRLAIQVDTVNILSDDQRAAQIAATGILGGPVAMLTVAATPMKVGMQATVSLIDDQTNTVLASSPITTIVSQEGKTDPGPALFRQNATDTRQWLLSGK